MLTFILILFVLVVIFLLRIRIPDRKRVVLLFVCIMGFMSFIGFTYGKWEYLTWRYGQEIRVALNNHLDIEELKVFSREKVHGKVFIEDQQGNKWIYYVRRGTPGGYLIDNFEILHSAQDDSASQLIYWY